MTGNFELLQPGISRYHHIGLVVPLLSAVFPFVIAPYFSKLEGQHHVFTALMLGAFTAVFAYVLLTFVPYLSEDQYTLNKAILLGLLAAEILIFTYPRGDFWDDRVISPPMLIFYLFMYLIGISEITRE